MNVEGGDMEGGASPDPHQESPGGGMDGAVDYGRKCVFLYDQIGYAYWKI